MSTTPTICSRSECQTTLGCCCSVQPTKPTTTPRYVTNSTPGWVYLTLGGRQVAVPPGETVYLEVS